LIKLIKNTKSKEMVRGCGYQGDTCLYDYNHNCLVKDECRIDKSDCGWTDFCDEDYVGCYKADWCPGIDNTYDPCFDFA
jgi:hypothetical protein